jgi:hypothetical protein
MHKKTFLQKKLKISHSNNLPFTISPAAISSKEIPNSFPATSIEFSKGTTSTERKNLRHCLQPSRPCAQTRRALSASRDREMPRTVSSLPQSTPYPIL